MPAQLQRLSRTRSTEYAIQGRFKKYQFEIRAYQCINDSLKSINLISLEAEMLIQLKKSSMSIKDLNPDTTYSLRKIEYDALTIGLDQQGGKEKAMQNMQYHIEKLKQKSSEADRTIQKLHS